MGLQLMSNAVLRCFLVFGLATFVDWFCLPIGELQNKGRDDR